MASAEFSSRHAGRPEVNLLTDFGEKPKSEAFNLGPDGGTPTHSALWYARAALLQRPETRKIILVVTDGLPADPDQTLAATRRCLREGIEVGAIGIETDAVKRFWNNHRVLTRLPDLPREMFAMMEEMLLRRPLEASRQIPAV